MSFGAQACPTVLRGCHVNVPWGKVPFAFEACGFVELIDQNFVGFIGVPRNVRLA